MPREIESLKSALIQQGCVNIRVYLANAFAYGLVIYDQFLRKHLFHIYEDTLTEHETQEIAENLLNHMEIGDFIEDSLQTV